MRIDWAEVFLLVFATFHFKLWRNGLLVAPRLNVSKSWTEVRPRWKILKVSETKIWQIVLWGTLNFMLHVSEAKIWQIILSGFYKFIITISGQIVRFWVFFINFPINKPIVSSPNSPSEGSSILGIHLTFNFSHCFDISNCFDKIL